MKLFIMTILVLFALPSYSQVFKCKSMSGDTSYQSTECPGSKKQNKVFIQHVDPKLIIEAQKRLNEALKQKKTLDLARQEQALKEQKIAALNAQIESNKELAEVIRNNAEALNNDNKSNLLNNYYYNGRNQYWYPPYRYPYRRKYKQYKNHPNRAHQYKKKHALNPPSSHLNPPLGR